VLTGGGGGGVPRVVFGMVAGASVAGAEPPAAGTGAAGTFGSESLSLSKTCVASSSSSHSISSLAPFWGDVGGAGGAIGGGEEPVTVEGSGGGLDFGVGAAGKELRPGGGGGAERATTGLATPEEGAAIDDGGAAGTEPGRGIPISVCLGLGAGTLAAATMPGFVGGATDAGGGGGGGAAETGAGDADGILELAGGGGGAAEGGAILAVFLPRPSKISRSEPPFFSSAITYSPSIRASK
jgi:hypothetical protein